MTGKIRIAAAALGLAAAWGPASAHHSFAMFDFTKQVTIEGAVRDFQWVNPHSVLWIYGGPPGGAPTVWSLEMSSPNNLLRMGWDKRSLKPGDRVKVVLNPMREGGSAGALRSATLVETGQVFNTQRLVAGTLRPDLK